MFDRRVGFCVLLGVCFLLTFPAAGEEQQWLQYRSSGATRATQSTYGQDLPLTSERPQGVALPQFNSPEPLFAKWKTPLIKQGYLWVALDRSRKKGSYDRLLIDSDGDGDLSDESSVSVSSLTSSSARLDPVQILLAGDDGPVAYHLSLRLSGRGSDKPRLSATAGGWYEGTVTVGGKKRKCVLIDNNANGTFNDAFLDFRTSDQITIGTSQQRMTAPVGKYIQVDDVLYGLKVSPDGSCIRFSPLADQKLAAVRVPEGVRKLSAGGENGLLFLSAANGIVQLPPGAYRVNHWETHRKDENGVPWEIAGSRSPKPVIFEARLETQTTVEIGGPAVASVRATKRGRTYVLGSPMVRGQHGERIRITRAGRRPPPPKLRIKSADGSYNRRFTFAYG